MYLFSYVIGGLLLALLIAALLPRWLCRALGAIGLLLGIVLPIGLWTYASYFVPGDPSGQGMLGTICVILFAPAGLALTVLAYFKSE